MQSFKKISRNVLTAVALTLLLFGVAGFFVAPPALADASVHCSDNASGFASGTIIHYAGNVSCILSSSAFPMSSIVDTFSVQYLNGTTWQVEGTQRDSCSNCSELFSPSQFSTYTYAANSGKYRVVEQFAAKETSSSSPLTGKVTLGVWSFS